jgi:hypothetical protein
MRNAARYLAFEFIPLLIASILIMLALYGHIVGRTIDDLIHTCGC